MRSEITNNTTTTVTVTQMMSLRFRLKVAYAHVLRPRAFRAARILVPGAEYAERGFRASRRGKGAERRGKAAWEARKVEPSGGEYEYGQCR